MNKNSGKCGAQYDLYDDNTSEGYIFTCDKEMEHNGNHSSSDNGWQFLFSIDQRCTCLKCGKTIQADDCVGCYFCCSPIHKHCHKDVVICESNTGSKVVKNWCTVCDFTKYASYELVLKNKSER